MKYFRWTHEQMLNMSYDNYVMYLSSIPRYDKDDDKEEEDPPTKSIDLANLYG